MVTMLKMMTIVMIMTIIADAEDTCQGYDDNLDNDNDGIPDDCDDIIDSDNDNVSDLDDTCPGYNDSTCTKCGNLDEMLCVSFVCAITLICVNRLLCTSRVHQTHINPTTA